MTDPRLIRDLMLQDDGLRSVLRRRKPRKPPPVDDTVLYDYMRGLTVREIGEPRGLTDEQVRLELVRAIRNRRRS